jgi:hypothetical protein
MRKKPAYVVDSDVFITAKNRYYAFDICPGFWNSVIHHYGTGSLRSIDKVRQELLLGRPDEDLVQWVKKEVPADFFLDTAQQDVMTAYGQVMLWVQRHSRYSDQAKAEFATKADGWLVAYAKVHGVCVATNEQPAPESRREVKLPDVCTQFGVRYEDTFAMLRALRVRYDYRE